MKEILAVAAGGTVGAVARYLVYVAAGRLLGSDLPFGTLIVNILGSFVMGALVESIALTWSVRPETQLFLMVGVLGAFTTFSAFSLDVAVLYERGRVLLPAVYIASSVTLSIAALFAGLYLMRRILAHPL